MSHIKKAVLSAFVGYRVRITFFDDEVKEGVLGYTSKFCEEQGFRKPGYFTLNNLDFKVSHIKKVVLID